MSESSASASSASRVETAGVSAPSRAQRFAQFFFVLFCLEIGLVLVFLPWTELWNRNYFFSLAPEWHLVWLSSYLRGAVSGLGLLDIWIGLGELWRMLH